MSRARDCIPELCVAALVGGFLGASQGGPWAGLFGAAIMALVCAALLPSARDEGEN